MRAFFTFFCLVFLMLVTSCGKNKNTSSYDNPNSDKANQGAMGVDGDQE